MLEICRICITTLFGMTRGVWKWEKFNRIWFDFSWILNRTHIFFPIVFQNQIPKLKFTNTASSSSLFIENNLRLLSFFYSYKATMRLNISKIRSYDYGEYSCICKNELGIAKAVFHLQGKWFITVAGRRNELLFHSRTKSVYHARFAWLFKSSCVWCKTSRKGVLWRCLWTTSNVSGMSWHTKVIFSIRLKSLWGLMTVSAFFKSN